jgi:methionyl-tRNA synthetase
LISFQEFQRVELRAAKILKAEDIPGRDKLFRLEVDAGEPSPRTLVAGLKPHYSTKELAGKSIVVVSNLAPATIAGIESNGMLLAADLNGQPVLLSLDRDVPPGTIIR